MSTPIVYHSIDPSAPTLVNSAGSLIDVLDACLVNGYGDKPAAGWTKEYSGTNLAAYRMGEGGTSIRAYLRIDDSDISYSQVSGHASMSSINDVVERMPALASGTPHLWFMKNAYLTSGQPRSWTLIADSRTFYLFFHGVLNTSHGSITKSLSCGLSFGEYESLIPGFDKNIMFAARSNNGVHSFNAHMGRRMQSSVGFVFAARHEWILRDWSNALAAKRFRKMCLTYRGSSGGTSDAAPMGLVCSNYDIEPINQVGEFSEAFVFSFTPSPSKMGKLRGFLCPLTLSEADDVYGHLAIIEGAGALAEQQIMIIGCGAGDAGGASNDAAVGINLTSW